MAIRLPAFLVFLAFALAAGMGSAAKRDSTPPATIGTITVKSSARALTLEFFATGDDGSTGTAAAYDVFYKDYQDGTTCSDADNPGSDPDASDWTRAERSVETIPEPAGNVDFFNVRPLVSATKFCMAIRARDEASNWSGWRVVPGTTESDDWTLTPTPVDAAAPADGDLEANYIHLAYVDGQPVLGWSVLQFVNDTCCTTSQIVFAGEQWRQQIALADYGITSNISSFRMAGDPGSYANGPHVGAVVTGSSVTGSGKRNMIKTNYYWLVEATPSGAPSVSVIASGEPTSDGVDNVGFGTSSMTYVFDNDSWNPVATVERVESKASNLKTTTLRLTERVNGAWQDTPLLWHQGPDQGAGFFPDAEVFTEPDGKTLGVVAAHCGITVYAERVGGNWSYYDAGPALTRYRVTFDGSGDLVVLGQTGYGAADPVILRRADFQSINGPPAASCSSVPPTAASAGEVVHVPADPDVPWVFTSGIAESGGATFLAIVAADGLYKTVEQRLIYRCNPGEPWTTQVVDRTNSPQTRSQPILTPAGELLEAYSWGMFARALSFGPAYTTRPPDAVYVATHSGNLCP